MGESNGDWGELAAHDSEMAAAWDGYALLPEPGVNPILDSFAARKNISIADLVRTGARLSDGELGQVLTWQYGGTGIKYRDMVSDVRWSYAGSEWRDMKRVPRRDGIPVWAIVAEGETDGARLSALYPQADVYILPAGADPRPHTERYAAQLDGYELILLAHDPDTAGERGADLLAHEVQAKAVRWTAGTTDWSAAELHDGPPPLPDPAQVETPVAERLLVSARDLLQLDAPAQASWFEQALLPIGGSMIVHGWTKSYKSFLVLDIASSLAQCQPWCQFEPTEEPVKVAVMQYEIPWPYFQQRVRVLAANAADPQAFLDNFIVWTPMARPRFKAGDDKAERAVIEALRRAGVQVFVLDPVRRATGIADLNKENEVRPLLEFFERLNDAGITVITVHHDNKSQRGTGDAAAMTGSGAFAGDFDTILSVALPKDAEPEDPTRDIHFLLRNAPSPLPRQMEMTESGLIVYRNSPLNPSLDPNHEDPAI